MSILDKIVGTKKQEIAEAKKFFPKSWLMDRALFHTPGYRLKAVLQQGEAQPVITEFKRRSPSKGWIYETADTASVCTGYATAGAAAISVLTDSTYFGGSLTDLNKAREAVAIPLLRKDFMLEPYQLYEAKAHGADIVLLIAAILSPAQVQELAQEAHSIGLEVLLELHDESELQHVCAEADMVGINNRNLKNFEVDVDQSIRLQHMLPRQTVRVAESGIHSPEVALQLLQAGFNCLLMGEYFMKHKDPAIAFARFSNQLKTLADAG